MNPRAGLAAAGCFAAVAVVQAADDPGADRRLFASEIRPLASHYCFQCHSTAKHKGDVDLEGMTSYEVALRHPEVWQKVVDELDDEEMPPDEAKRHPSPAERGRLVDWARGLLGFIAAQTAGDPGSVVLRRLSNAEYTATIEDLTGLASFNPAKEFPEDGAAGEGFTNAGQALVMSPTLISKYLDAAKSIADHAVLYPDGLRFSPKVARLDLSHDIEADIRRLYRRYAEVPPDGVNLQGDKRNLADTIPRPADNGRLPVASYLAATLEERARLEGGETTPAEVARRRGLSRKYLTLLWNFFSGRDAAGPFSEKLRDDWRRAVQGDAPALAREIREWQDLTWKFSPVGQLQENGLPKAWMTPVLPIAQSREVHLRLLDPATGSDIVFYLAAGTAGGAAKDGALAWRNPRLLRAGQPAIALRDVRAYLSDRLSRRAAIFSATARYLAAANEIARSRARIDVAAFARGKMLDPRALRVWVDLLGIDPDPSPSFELLSHPLAHPTRYDFVQGWGEMGAPGVVANSTDDQRVVTPGIIWPHSVVLHPGASQYAAVGWNSPVRARLRIEAKITAECPYSGNGVTWSLQLRHGRFRRRLVGGTAFLLSEIREFSPGVAAGPVEVSVEPGDVVSLLIGPRGSDNLDDHTGVELDLSILDGSAEHWSLRHDVSSNILAANPHPDSKGRPGVWSFYTEQLGLTEGLPVIPDGSLLSRWRSAGSEAEREGLAGALQALLTSAPPPAAEHPDAKLYRDLTSLGGPFFIREPWPASSPGSTPVPLLAYGLDRSEFGRTPDGRAIGNESLAVTAPSCIEVRLPAELFAGSEFVATAELLQPNALAACANQAGAFAARPATLDQLWPGEPILASPGTATFATFARDVAAFSQLFPAALCYTEIRPNDEQNSLAVYHRDDAPYCRLMLDEAEQGRLDRLWEDLHFVSQDALAVADNYDYALDSSKKILHSAGWPTTSLPNPPPPVAAIERADASAHRLAAAFAQSLQRSEAAQLESILEFADRAYRRPLTEPEKAGLRRTYRRLRGLALSHEAAARLTLARILVSPCFLYRGETAPPGTVARRVSDAEMATRLSYFLWSSGPDAELRRAADGGRLHDPAEILGQAHRLLRDRRVRNLATEFGCEWLRIHAFDQLVEKSARTFPSFPSVRSDIYEETIEFLTDLFQSNRPVLSLLDADYTFLNESLARHYGIPGVEGPQWRKIEGIHRYSRGGVLAQASVLAQRAGSSRTSPIQRGSWIVETLLGAELPKPPPNVPLLPADEKANQLTMRELTERHTSDPLCASCHVRFTALGYTLEGFDAVGRLRTTDAADQPLDTSAKLADGTRLSGFDDLRAYLLHRKRDEFVRQFCRKLLGYALGRSVQLSDQPLIREMEGRLAASNYRVGTAIDAILESRQFRYIRGRDYLVSN